MEICTRFPSISIHVLALFIDQCSCTLNLNCEQILILTTVLLLELERRDLTAIESRFFIGNCLFWIHWLMYFKFWYITQPLQKKWTNERYNSDYDYNDSPILCRLSVTIFLWYLYITTLNFIVLSKQVFVSFKAWVAKCQFWKQTNAESIDSRNECVIDENDLNTIGVQSKFQLRPVLCLETIWGYMTGNKIHRVLNNDLQWLLSIGGFTSVYHKKKGTITAIILGVLISAKSSKIVMS